MRTNTTNYAMAMPFISRLHGAKKTPPSLPPNSSPSHPIQGQAMLTKQSYGDGSTTGGDTGALSRQPLDSSSVREMRSLS